MTVEALIFGQLSGHAGLSALVGTRIYPNRLPANVDMPAVVYHRVTDEEPQPQHASGTTDLVRARYQFDAWGSTHDSASAVRVQVRDALKLWSAAGPPVIQVAFHLTSIDLYDDKAQAHNCSCDFEVNFEE